MTTKTMTIISIVITIFLIFCTISMFYTGPNWLFWVDSFLAVANGIYAILGIIQLREEKRRKKYEEDVEKIWRSLKH